MVGAKPAGLLTKKKRALSHKGTEPETLMEPVTGIPRIRFANPLRLRMPAGILARSLRTLRVRLTLAPLQVRFRRIQETGPVPQKGTEPETLMEPVTGIEPATH